MRDLANVEKCGFVPRTGLGVSKPRANASYLRAACCVIGIDIDIHIEMLWTIIV